jgi:hypothetical protein
VGFHQGEFPWNVVQQWLLLQKWLL